MIAALKEQVAARKRDHADGRCRQLLGHPGLHRLGLHSQADAMAGGDSVGKGPVEHSLGEVFERESGAVERLVGVQIERQPGLLCQCQERLVGCCGVGLQVRAATDAVDAHRHRLAQQCTLLRPGRADAWPPAEREHLDAHQVGQQFSYVQQRRDRRDAVRLREVGVRANGGGAVGGDQPCRPLGSHRRVGLRDARAMRFHADDCAHQIAGGVGNRLGEERLVEMRVGLRHGRQQQPPVGRQHLVAGERRAAESRHHAADDAHRRGGAVGQQCIDDDQRPVAGRGHGERRVGVVRHRPPNRLGPAGRWPRPRTRCRRA